MTSGERERLALVGTGLLGTSIALAAIRAGHEVRGYDTDEAVLGVATQRSSLEPCSSLERCVANATLVLICTPIATIPRLSAEVLRLAPRAVVSDVGSVKSYVVDEVERVADAASLPRFVGGHPMGGSERSGPEGAAASLVDGIVWVVTPSDGTDPNATRRLTSFISGVGARPVVLEARRHDRLVGFVSHLPQVASTALMGLAASEEADEPDILLLAAGGFRDLTRLAASNPRLWSDILLANREALEEVLGLYIEALSEMRDLIIQGRAADVEGAFARAKEGRLSLAAKPQVKSGVAVLQIPVPDRPGALADLTARLGAAEVNIEDIQIVHSAEGGRGTVHLTIALGQASAADAVLREGEFEPTRLA